MQQNSATRVFNPTVLSILFVALGAMTSGLMLESPLLLYLNHLHYTTSPKATFYVTAVSLGFLTPALSTIPLGHLASRFGAGRTMLMAYIVVIIAMVVVLTARFNRWVFLVGYACYSITMAIRILRFTLISDIVPSEHRTMVMAIHQLMIPIACLIAPLIWLICQQWKGEIILISHFLVLDRFSISLLIGIGIVFINVVMCYSMLLKPQLPIQRVPKVDSFQIINKNEDPNNYESCSEQQEDSFEQSANNGNVSRLSLFFFIFVLLSVRLAVMVILALFQPIMVHRFGADDATIGHAYLLLGFVGLFPPISVALLSKFLDDWTLLMIGLFLQIVGIVMYLPPFTFLRKWQVFIGYGLVLKASTFCTTSLISLFTKIFQGSPKQMGYLWAFANIIPVLIQIALADALVQLYATWKFTFFLLPISVSFLMILSPFGRKLLIVPETKRV